MQRGRTVSSRCADDGGDDADDDGGTVHKPRRTMSMILCRVKEARRPP